MSERVRNNVAIAVGLIGIAGFALGTIQSLAVLPHRVAKTEQALATLEINTKADREILIRIEERLKSLADKIERK